MSKPKLIVQDKHSIGIGVIQYRPGEPVPEPDAETLKIWLDTGAAKWYPEPAVVVAQAPEAVPDEQTPVPETDVVVLKQLPEKRQK